MRHRRADVRACRTASSTTAADLLRQTDTSPLALRASCTRRGAIGPLTAACCPNGDQCAGGPPPECEESCADVFLPFMDT